MKLGLKVYEYKLVSAWYITLNDYQVFGPFFSKQQADRAISLVQAGQDYKLAYEVKL